MSSRSKQGKALGLGRLLETQKRLGALGIFDRVSLTDQNAGSGAMRGASWWPSTKPPAPPSPTASATRRGSCYAAASRSRAATSGASIAPSPPMPGAAFAGSRFVLGYP